MHIEFTVITAFFPTQAAGLGFLLPGRVTDSVVPDRLIWGFSHLWPATRVGTERRRHSQARQEERNALGVQCLGDLLGLVCANGRMAERRWLCTWVPAAPTPACCTLNCLPALVQPNAGRWLPLPRTKALIPPLKYFFWLQACFPKSTWHLPQVGPPRKDGTLGVTS